MSVPLSVEFTRSYICHILLNLKNFHNIPPFQKSGNPRRFLKISVQLAAVLLPLAWATLSYSAQVTLAWNANKEPDLAGYRIYYGTSSGVYPFEVDLGKNTGCSISSLQEGTTYFFAATAYDTDGNESEFSVELSHTIRSKTNPTTVVVDNGDIGTSHTGTWKVSSGKNPYGNNSLYSNKGTYSFEIDAGNVYDVSIWWTSNRFRCTRVPVKIYDGENILDTVVANQQRNGGQWNFLGTYAFEDTARVVIISDGTCNTSADAVEFMP